MQTTHHKKNELFEVEFFKDKEYTEAFDFTNAKNLYIQPVNGDCTPIFALSNKLSGLGIKTRIFTPIWNLGWRDGISPQTPIVTLNDVLDGEDSSNVNLSKYIPEDNAVLFFTEKSFFEYGKIFQGLDLIASLEKGIMGYKKITIFHSHGTKSELQKAEEVAKELKEKYGIKEVNLSVLHWFVTKYKVSLSGVKYYDCSYDPLEILSNFNKTITTNSTGILKLEKSTERLQVIDAKEIFEEYLKENN